MGFARAGGSAVTSVKDLFASGLKIERCGGFVRLIFTSDKLNVIAQIIMLSDAEVPSEEAPPRQH